MWLNSASIDSLGHSWLLLVFWNISYRVIQYFYDCTLRQHIKIVNSDTNNSNNNNNDNNKTLSQFFF